MTDTVNSVQSLSPNSITKLYGVHPKLVNLMQEAIKNSPYMFIISQGVRTAEYQNSLYQQGRTIPGKIVTNADGYKVKSNHQIKSDGLGHAVDIAIMDGKKVDWDDGIKLDWISKDLPPVTTVKLGEKEIRDDTKRMEYIRLLTETINGRISSVTGKREDPENSNTSNMSNISNTSNISNMSNNNNTIKR